MIPNPIHKVLLTLATHQVRYLLMGGQACVLYGAAEFSRDTDLNVPATTDNLEHLTAALSDLQATCIAVPPWNWDYLNRGHALHRILVLAKKTQKDKDWRMIRRLHYARHRASPTPEQEREADRIYWAPLRKELQELRRKKRGE